MKKVEDNPQIGKSAAEAIINQIIVIVEGFSDKTVLLRLLVDLEMQAQQVDGAQRSAKFHNSLRGFIRVWGDQWCPEEKVISPLLASLFELHGFPGKGFEPM